jgi:hypothetical protein
MKDFRQNQEEKDCLSYQENRLDLFLAASAVLQQV